MRQFSPLRPTRTFFLSILAIAILAFQSCVDYKEVRASIDGSNEKEGGASELNNELNVGTNVGICFMIGIPGRHSSSAGSYLPEEKENTEPWVLSGQLEFVQKGSKFQSSKTTLNYVNAIGDVLYQHPLDNGSVLYGGLGPYIGYGIGGHVKTGDFKASAFGGDDGYKRFDAGLHLTAGYRLPMGLSFNLAYEYGLINKSPASDFTSRNRTISFQLGYSLEKIIGGFKKK